MQLLRKLIFLLIFLIVLWISASLIWLNPQEVELNLLFATFKPKLGEALLGALVSGMLLGILSMFLPWMKRANTARKLGKNLRTKEKEVENLRKLPMQDSE